ncbi:MAG: mechanosensitive ion channel, partial [Anaerolineales bacterium]|nr:mechanosensitive ion channel [Anaerolineales bacterium]
IPNSKFTNNKITNTSRFTGHWQAENYVLSAALSADQIRLAMQLIEQVVISTSGVKMGGMRINGIDVKGINIILFYLIEDGDERNHIVSEISLRILELFEEHELQFAFLGRLESALQGMELGVLG